MDAEDVKRIRHIEFQLGLGARYAKAYGSTKQWKAERNTLKAELKQLKARRESI